MVLSNPTVLSAYTPYSAPVLTLLRLGLGKFPYTHSQVTWMSTHTHSPTNPMLSSLNSGWHISRCGFPLSQVFTSHCIRVNWVGCDIKTALLRHSKISRWIVFITNTHPGLFHAPGLSRSLTVIVSNTCLLGFFSWLIARTHSWLALFTNGSGDKTGAYVGLALQFVYTGWLGNTRHLKKKKCCPAWARYDTTYLF